MVKMHIVLFVKLNRTETLTDVAFALFAKKLVKMTPTLELQLKERNSFIISVKLKFVRDGEVQVTG